MKPVEVNYQKLAKSEYIPKIAVIGCGAVAEILYLPALSKYPSILKKIVLVDNDKERVQKLFDLYNAGNYAANYKDIFKEKIDGVIISTPPHLHYPIAKDFLSKGIPVLCEKPIAESAKQASDIISLASETGTKVLVNYQRRLYATSIKIKEIISKGTLGDPLSIEYSEGEIFRWPTVSGFYFNNKISTRGVLLDKGAHVLDLMCFWLGGKPNLLKAQTDSFGGHEAVALVEFQHEKCLGRIKLSLLGKASCIYKIKFENGAIEGDINDFQSLILTGKNGKRKRIHYKTMEKCYSDFGHTIVSNFLNLISNEEQPLISCTEVLDSAKWIDECYESASRFILPWYEIAKEPNEP